MPDATSPTSSLALLGRVPSGIYVITLRHGGQETGILASWVMQAGFEPPMVTVAVKHGRYVGNWLSAGARFALNVVAEDGKKLMSHFRRGFAPGESAFDGLIVNRADGDVPVLAEGMLGYLLCEPRGHVDTPDHRVFTAEVVGGRLYSEAQPKVHVRKSGASY